KRLGLIDDIPKLDRARLVLHRVDPAAPVNHEPDAAALQIWRNARLAARTVVAEYLERRGIPLTPPPSLRCGTVMHLDRYEMPTMVAAVQRPDGQVISVQTMAEIPVWASLGCQRLHRIELPEVVQEVHIFGDNDVSGRAPAQRASEGHMELGRRVVLRFPPDGLKDFNDLLNADADESLRDLRPDSVKVSVAA